MVAGGTFGSAGGPVVAGGAFGSAGGPVVDVVAGGPVVLAVMDEDSQAGVELGRVAALSPMLKGGREAACEKTKGLAFVAWSVGPVLLAGVGNEGRPNMIGREAVGLRVPKGPAVDVLVVAVGPSEAASAERTPLPLDVRDGIPDVVVAGGLVAGGLAAGGLSPAAKGPNVLAAGSLSPAAKGLAAGGPSPRGPNILAEGGLSPAADVLATGGPNILAEGGLSPAAKGVLVEERSKFNVVLVGGPDVVV